MKNLLINQMLQKLFFDTLIIKYKKMQFGWFVFQNSIFLLYRTKGDGNKYTHTHTHIQRETDKMNA